MATVSIRGKDKLLAHFRNVNQPFWKLYNISDTKTPIQQFVSGNHKKIDTSMKFLNDILDSLDPSGTYVLDTYEASEDGRNAQRFLKPDTSICFTISDSVIPQSLTGTPEPKKPTFDSSPASLKDHIDLIHQNAKLSAECSMLRINCNTYLEAITELKKEISELNEELDEYEAECEEEEEETESVSGAPKNYEEAISKIIVEHGGALIENLMSKGVKGDIPADPMEPEGEVKVNGLGELPELSVIVGELQRYDPILRNHLYKLMLIAQQKPHTFKMFLTKLESY